MTENSGMPAAAPDPWMAPQVPAPSQPYYGPPPSQPPYGAPAAGQPAYGQPAYGQVPYGQVPYGQVPYGQVPYGQAPVGFGYGQPYPAVKTGVNGFAVACLVFGVFWMLYLGTILSIIFGCIALTQIKRDGGRGRILAIIGLTFAGLWTVVFILGFARGLATGMNARNGN